MKPRRNGPNSPGRSSATCPDAKLEELRQETIASLRQTIESGTLPPRWQKLFEKDLRAFETMRWSK